MNLINEWKSCLIWIGWRRKVELKRGRGIKCWIRVKDGVVSTVGSRQRDDVSDADVCINRRLISGWHVASLGSRREFNESVLCSDLVAGNSPLLSPLSTTNFSSCATSSSTSTTATFLFSFSFTFFISVLLHSIGFNRPAMRSTRSILRQSWCPAGLQPIYSGVCSLPPFCTIRIENRAEDYLDLLVYDRDGDTIIFNVMFD